MSPDDEGRPATAGEATPDSRHDHHQRTAREPAPPRTIDLGGGRCWTIGTAADFRAAADWLARSYPEHSADPPDRGELVVLNMTWTKFGDEYPAAAREMTDAEFRTHAEALMWSSFRLLDLRVPKRDVRRFAETDDPDQAVKGLVDKGWWEDGGDHWHIGVHFAEWQQDKAQVEHRREYVAAAQRRGRAHKRGDHSLCIPGKCPHAVSTVDRTVDTTRDSTRDPGRDGSGPTVPPVPSSKDLGQGQNFGRVGDAVDDRGVPGGSPGEGQPIANSHRPRVHDGPVSVADDAQHDGRNHSPTPAADRNARASEPEPAAPRRCEFGGCPTPDKPLASSERIHLGCGALIRRAERAQAEGGAGAPLSEPAQTAASDEMNDPPGFAAFWDAYPKHTGKPAAGVAWDLAVTRADPEAIIDAARRYAATSQDGDRRYLKAPAAWLADDSWLDFKPARPSFPWDN